MPSNVTAPSDDASLDGDVWYVDLAKTFSSSRAGDVVRIEVEGVEGIPDDAKAQRAARRLVNHALAWGWNPKPGQLYERGWALAPAFDRSISWWAQLELVNALSLMDALHGERTPVYRDALGKAWRFTRETLLDGVHGGIFQGVDAEGRVDRTKSHDWMATYHAARALVLTSDRLRDQAAGAR